MTWWLRNYISKGDFIDLFNLLRLKGISFVFKGLKLWGYDRTTNKWNNFECSESDFWVIPEVTKRWNKIISGNPLVEYEDYFVEKYLREESGLKMLSVGCGIGSHEQRFSKYPCFESIEGVDISEKRIALARIYASEDSCQNVNYRVSNFETEKFPENGFNVILFHSSLHHFKNIQKIIKEHTLPILRSKGFLIIMEYTGPNKLQWTKAQLKASNNLLKELPIEKKSWFKAKSQKKYVYRPGLLRMFLSDPSEAIDSESIIKILHDNFSVLEEKKMGGNLLQPTLKGISHHFSNGTNETNKLLNKLFEVEDLFLKDNLSDFMFGVYKKRD